MNKVFASALFFFFITGCATIYQPKNLFGGYSASQINENTWKVTFEGNGYTSKTRTENFAMRRAAEITLREGYTHFLITDSDTYVKTSMHTIPQSSRTTGTVSDYGNFQYADTIYYGGQTYTVSKPSTNSYFVLVGETQANEINSLNGLVFNAELFLSQFLD